MPVDIEKRKRIMQRSIALGHCICNPKQGCPCDTFREKNLCPCAGERPEETLSNVKLTQLVEKAGCASKINQNDLREILSNLPVISDPNVLVGTNTCDDAGVYRLDDNTALVQTVDVFAPSVDDPYTFGQIAAANSLSDVYAMGGRPLTALSIIGFPIETLDRSVMIQMLRGGLDKMREAGVVVIGGHSINDQNPKFGYAVTGTVSVSGIVTNDKAKPGDVLILTKPLGVGIISFAGQLGRASEKSLAAAASSMSALNKSAAEAMVEVGVSAATDVTGFGLLGHLAEMVTQSGVSAEIQVDQVPVFDEVLDYVAQGMISGGVERNREYASGMVTASDNVPEDFLHVLYDPQTSGGLLISVPEAKAETLLLALKNRGVEAASVIGRITEGPSRIVIENKGETMNEHTVEACCGGNGHSDCCTAPPEIGASNVKRQFGAFMDAVYSGGAVPVKTKELIAIALSVLSKCEPCVKIHIEEAKNLGISEDEISEAVWMAVSFGGAPTLMFYRSITEKS